MKRLMNTIEHFELLQTFDSVFSPALSEDIPDLKSYAEKLTENADTLVIEERNTSAGFITFYVNDEELEDSFITLLAVLPEFQGRSLAPET